jgi:hypothetical protein
MQIKINEKMLSFPPYISTSWQNIISLQLEDTLRGPILIIELVSGSRIHIPHLERAVIEHIFAAHSLFLEKQSPKKAPDSFPFALPLDLLSGSVLQGMSPLLQHNLEQANTPDFPRELLDKMISLAKNMGVEDISSLPKAEPHCNCPHCQIMRAFHTPSDAPLPEEDVSEEDLKFRTWDIEQQEDQLYVVTNPLNKEEHYRVFLGQPIGCTCGEKNCEHIQAVLHT